LKFNNRVHRSVTCIFILVYLLEIILALLGHFNLAYSILQVNAALFALYLMGWAYMERRRGNRQALNFLRAWSIFLIGVVVFALKDYQIIPYNSFSFNAMTVGSAIETVLLSFALADRINQFKREKEESQLQALQALQENQRLVQEQNVILEGMVQERTVDLERTNTELSDTLQDLRLTQKQLVESEKLASLGQMTAGIAHEINNPINFVQSNVLPLKRDVDDVLALLDEFAQMENDEHVGEKVTAFHKKYHELDMPYVKKEVGQLLNGIEEGSRRTAEIVRGLRVFSRMDRDTLVSSGINDCIYSTLMVMKNMTRDTVTIEIDLKPDLPPIDCFPGKLSQVFMNIINNGIQATELPGRTPSQRIIHIASDGDDQRVWVTITDNGAGIPEEILPKIFDPFFTTKNVGEGTGLGLSIAIGIIKEHEGQIEVRSEVNKGTTVVVTLPRFTSHC
jgi:two-component system, NtrC family, sensor kinase